MALNEFEAAIVPNDVDPEIREALEGAGLDVRDYDPEVTGDREKVTLEAANDAGNVMFSVTGADAFVYYPPVGSDSLRTERVRKDLAELQLRYNLPRIYLFGEFITVEDLMAIDHSLRTDEDKRKEAEKLFKKILDKKVMGYYFPSSGEIAIFAHNIPGPIYLENTVFHEVFHSWFDHYNDKGLANKVVNDFYAQGTNVNQELYDDVSNDDYDEEERPEEFMAYQIATAMNLGDLEEDVYKYLPQEHKIIIDDYLNNIGYDREKEESARKETVRGLNSRPEKSGSESPDNSENAANGRKADSGEGRDDTQGVKFSISAAVDTGVSDEELANYNAGSGAGLSISTMTTPTAGFTVPTIIIS